MANLNRVIWTTDWHCITDAEATIQWSTKQSEIDQVVGELRGLGPVGIIDTGDAKDYFGAGTGYQHDIFIEHVADRLLWLPVNEGFNARYPTLPGNHDEIDDSTSVDNGAELALWNAKFWPSPYHWTADWPAPKIRFIALHASIVHSPSGLAGYFSIASSETDWLTAQLAGLPAGYSAIVCSHPAVLTAIGNEIHSTLGGSTLLSILAANNDKVLAYLNGHRHQGWLTVMQDSIPHLSAGGVAGSSDTAQTRGNFVILEHDPVAHTVTFHRHAGPPSFYGNYRADQYTPLQISVPSRSLQVFDGAAWQPVSVTVK